MSGRTYRFGNRTRRQLHEKTPSSEDQTGPRRACEGAGSKDVGPYRPIGLTDDTEDHLGYERSGVHTRRPNNVVVVH